MRVEVRDRADRLVVRTSVPIRVIEYDEDGGEISLIYRDDTGIERVRITMSKRDLLGIASWTLTHLA